MAVIVPKSNSMASFLNTLLTTDKAIINAQKNSEGAQQEFPGLIKRLARLLDQQGYDSKIIVLKGFKRDLKQPSKDLEKVSPKDVEHAVIKVGNLFIDPCNKRLGTGYDLPWNYQENLWTQYWNSAVDRTDITKIDKESAANLVKIHGVNFYGRANSMNTSISAGEAVYIKYASERGIKINDKVKIVKNTYLQFSEGRSVDYFSAFIDEKIVKFKLDVATSEKFLSKCNEVKGAVELKKVKALFFSKVKELSNVAKDNSKSTEIGKEFARIMKRICGKTLNDMSVTDVIKCLKKSEPADAVKYKKFAIEWFSKTGKRCNSLKSFEIVPENKEQKVTVSNKKPQALLLTIKPTTDGIVTNTEPLPLDRKPRKVDKKDLKLPSSEDFDPDEFDYDPAHGPLRIEAKNE